VLDVMDVILYWSWDRRRGRINVSEPVMTTLEPCTGPNSLASQPLPYPRCAHGLPKLSQGRLKTTSRVWRSVPSRLFVAT
jgi:hypothetical protein